MKGNEGRTDGSGSGVGRLGDTLLGINTDFSARPECPSWSGFCQSLLPRCLPEIPPVSTTEHLGELSTSFASLFIFDIFKLKASKNVTVSVHVPITWILPLLFSVYHISQSKLQSQSFPLATLVYIFIN